MKHSQIKLSTDWQSLLINGRAPRAGEPFADEYSRRLARWASELTRSGNVKARAWGDPQIASDYRRAAR